MSFKCLYPLGHLTSHMLDDSVNTPTQMPLNDFHAFPCSAKIKGSHINSTLAVSRHHFLEYSLMTEKLRLTVEKPISQVTQPERCSLTGGLSSDLP